MGQKTHPYGFRLGYNKPWKSRWYADRDYADLLHEDVALRKQLKDKLRSAGKMRKSAPTLSVARAYLGSSALLFVQFSSVRNICLLNFC